MRNAEVVLAGFLSKHKAENGVLDKMEVARLNRLTFGTSGLPETSRFSATVDSYLYGKLISQLLGGLSPAQRTLFDLGSGSCIPTLKALLENPLHTGLRVVGVEQDLDAITISRVNVAKVGFADRYQFVAMDLGKFLAEAQFTCDNLICSNPPYVPVPPSLIETKFDIVNGGEDGTRFLNQILSYPYSTGTHVAVAWSSLSNPLRVISQMEDRFEVLFVQAFRTPLGVYTGSQELSPYLHEQRDLGVSIFWTGKDSIHSYLMLGTILRRK